MKKPAKITALAILGLALSGFQTPAVAYQGPLSAEAEVFKGSGGKQPRAAKPGLRSRQPGQFALEIDLGKPQPRKKFRAADDSGGPMQIGFGREVPAPLNHELDLAPLQWQQVEGGQVISGVIRSDEAVAMRIGMQFFQLPDRAEFRFYHPQDLTRPIFVASGLEINQALEVTRSSREPDDPEPVLYWSPVVEASALGVELYLPDGLRPADVRLAIPKVSHINAGFLSTQGVGPSDAGLSLPCHNNAICNEGRWGSAMNGVARMVIGDGSGAQWLCSGNLVADSDPDTQIPYFLTATHCIDSQIQAASLQLYWFYRQPDCDGGKLVTATTTTGGAVLLSHSEYADMTLLRLAKEPPVGAVMLGWDANPVTTFPRAVTGIHHPKGDYQKISFGKLKQYGGVAIASTSGFFGAGPISGSENYAKVVWEDGLVEPGSSGSGLFLSDTQKLVGVLSWGASPVTCRYPNGQPLANDAFNPYFGMYYARFDREFERSLHRWLGAEPLGCQISNGHWNFCGDSACDTCSEGQGDCDSDSQCTEGLVCGKDLGNRFGFSTTTDVCVKPEDAPAAPQCMLSVGDPDYCADPACGPCAEGQGDCDINSECQSGLVCKMNASGNDLCEVPDALSCDKTLGDDGFCSDPACGPCDLGEYDCDTDADCATGLVCAYNVGEKYGLAAHVDVCETPVTKVCSLKPGDWGYCSDPACGPCLENQGDCDLDSECDDGLSCTSNVGESLGLHPNMDVCK